MPLLVPEHEIVPGEERWHPAVCTGCGAGCGTLVRVMDGERVVVRNGEQWRERIATIKKIEGNPLDPVSGGRLCARGQAEVQALYHPDRLRGPGKRSGQRGAGRFTPVSWDEAIDEAARNFAKARSEDPGRTVILTGPAAGTRSLALERFARSLKAPPPVVCSIAGHALERKAAEMVFGWKGLRVYDLANARYALGVGADFLGGWASPVYYARQFGHFRQGSPQVRGKLVQAESRLSLTAAAADRWLPLHPGSEPYFLAAVGGMLIEMKLARNLPALPRPVADVFRAADSATLAGRCGLEEKRLRDIVRELGESEAPLVFAGASAVHGNSLDALIAAHYLNLMLGNVGKFGGVLAPAAQAVAPPENHRAAEALAHARVVLLAGANPAYMLPRATGVLEALQAVDAVISLGSFPDDSAAWADLILPDHSALESAVAVIPAVSTGPAVTVAAPFVKPLYDTRPMEQTLADLAQKAGVPGASPAAVSPEDIYQPRLSEDLASTDVVRQGGLWLKTKPTPAVRVAALELELGAAVFDGDAAQYPLLFQPYLSMQYHDGSGSHLPWMQELPDPASNAIWGLPVEIDAATAASLRVSNGDVVRVESQHGPIEAPAYIHPGAIPGVASMAIGDGHTHYGRYASRRGANPLSILAPVWEKSTGALVLGGTRVRLMRVADRRGWIQFAAPDREERDQHR
jgi:anaerobic selenocysteine-containing dehydrogenase